MFIRQSYTKCIKILIIVFIILIPLNFFLHSKIHSIQENSILKLHKIITDNFKNILLLNINNSLSIENFIENSEFVTREEITNFVNTLNKNNKNLINFFFKRNGFQYSWKETGNKDFFLKRYTEIPLGLSEYKLNGKRYLLYKSNIKKNNSYQSIVVKYDFEKMKKNIDNDLLNYIKLDFSIENKNSNVNKDSLKFKILNKTFISTIERKRSTHLENYFYLFVLFELFLIIIFVSYVFYRNTIDYLKKQQLLNDNQTKIITDLDHNSFLKINKYGFIEDFNKKAAETWCLKSESNGEKSFFDLIYDENSKQIFRFFLLTKPEYDENRNLFIILKDRKCNKIPTSISWEYMELEGKKDKIIFHIEDVSEKLEKEKTIETLNNTLISKGCDLSSLLESADIIENNPDDFDAIIREILVLIKRLINPEKEIYFEILFNEKVILKEENPKEIEFKSFFKESSTNSIEMKLFYHTVDENKIFEREPLIKTIIERLLRVNERIIYHEELEMTNKNLEALVEDRTKDLAESIKELESFSGAVSHDLQNPIMMIQGYTEMLFHEKDEKLKEKYIKKILSGCKRMKSLINELLNLSRISQLTLNKKVTNLSEMFDEIIEESFSDTDNFIDFKVMPDLFANVDKSMFKIAMENIISNAVKYSSKKNDPVIEFGKDNMGYYIKDNGVGFNMKDYDKLFKIFSRLHSRNEFMGSGIGLHTVKRIIERHGGKIWAESAEGEGSIFYIDLDES